MQIVQKLISHLSSSAEKIKVAQVSVGVIYTVVRLEDNRTGLAMTSPGGTISHLSFLEMRPIAGRYAIELLVKATSLDLIEAAVGIATMNALLSEQAKKLFIGDSKDLISFSAKDRVGMIGYLRTFAPYIEKIGAELAVFEMEPADSEDSRILLPANRAFDYLPKCSVAIITGTTVINHTIDELLRATCNCREVMVVGPSTPLCPEIWRECGVTAICGVSVDDDSSSQAITLNISEGGGLRTIKKYLTKRMLRLERR